MNAVPQPEIIQKSGFNIDANTYVGSFRTHVMDEPGEWHVVRVMARDNADNLLDMREYEYPLLANVKPLAKLLGLPAFPITPSFPLLGPLGLVPYPVRYRIDVGRPFVEPPPRDPVDAPRRAEAVAGRVRGEIQRRLTRLHDPPAPA